MNTRWRPLKSQQNRSGPTVKHAWIVPKGKIQLFSSSLCGLYKLYREIGIPRREDRLSSIHSVEPHCKNCERTLKT